MSQENPLALPPANAEVLTNLKRWAKRATKGDKTARQELRQLMDRPDCFRLFRDLAHRLRETLISKIARDDWLIREIYVEELNRLRAELLGPAPTVIERLLAERIVIGWLEVHTAEYQLAVTNSESRSHWQQQVDHAHRRFLSALRLLAAVRRLPRPAVQVNIGEQQVNVSGPLP